MFENHSETELLCLMKNKDKFLEYIKQQYKNNDYPTPLEPIIWAIHFNISKYQRLPLLNSILLQNIMYIRKFYGFLPEKQILGKTYQILGIPTVCGVPNKFFLNAYKKYKSYYPVKFSKDKVIPELYDNITHDYNLINKQIGNSNFKRKCITSIIDQEIISSTPIITKTPLSFENNSSQISPIRTPIINEDYIFSTNTFYDSHILNMQNDIYQNSQQLPTDMLEISRLDILNTSQNTVSTKNLNNTQESIYFISRDPKYIQTESDISQSEINDLSNTSEKSLKNEIKDVTKNNMNNVTSIYLNDLKQMKNKEIKLEKSSISSQEEYSKLKSKLKKSMSFKHLNHNLLLQIPKIKRKKKQTYLESSMSSMSESQTRLKLSLSDISFSDIDKSAEIPIMKSGQWINKIEQNSIKLGINDSWEQNMNHLNMDIESQNYSDKENMFSADSSPKRLNLSDNERNNKYNMEFSTSHTSSLIFSDNSILCSNKTSNNYHQLDSNKHEFMKWSQDSIDENNYEENVSILLSKNMHINLSSSIDMSLLMNTSMYKSNFNENLE